MCSHPQVLAEKAAVQVRAVDQACTESSCDQLFSTKAFYSHFIHTPEGKQIHFHKSSTHCRL